MAKAAERLQKWCLEIEQWGWSGTFEPPTEEQQDNRRRSLESHIREHVRDSQSVETIGPLDYWGSLLSVEVKAHEARLDEIAEELPSLDFEDLKEYVMNMHSHRPSSSGYQTGNIRVNLMGDFAILVTQTVISALPYHTRLEILLKSWRSRIPILRTVPGYLRDLHQTQRALQQAWSAIEPPRADDLSDTALEKWKGKVNTIDEGLKVMLADLGQRMDKMLDLKEESETLPDRWIDELESLEADFGKWTVESRKRIINVDVLRKLAFKRMSVGNATLQLDGDDCRGSEARYVPPSTQRTTETVQQNQRFQLFIDTDTPATNGLDSDDDHDTVVHNEIDSATLDGSVSSFDKQSWDGMDSPAIISNDTPMSVAVRPTTPERASRRNSISSVDVSFASSPPIPDDSPSVRNAPSRQAKPPRPPLNSAMTKRRGGPKIIPDSQIESSPPWPPTRFQDQLSPTGAADDLESKISDILTTIPANIRLKSGPGKDARDIKSSRSISRSASRGYLRATRSINGLKSPEMTLSPAKSEFEGGANAASGRRTRTGMRDDNDIKLYHLTQPGREQPVKLHIRRVGENGERVMVRVGGGWADLGEYLRSYAEHHGRRTASEGKFEVLGLGLSEVKGEGGPGSRPGSAMTTTGKQGGRRSSFGVVAGGQTTPQKNTPSRLSKYETVATASDENVKAGTLNTPTTATAQPEASAPTSTSTVSSRHSWTGNEVGLAGPKIKKLELSEEKQQWIEGMLSQARKVSGAVVPVGARPDTPERQGVESRSESRMSLKGGKAEVFGDLGKVGGTKRVFLKRGSFGAGTEH